MSVRFISTLMFTTLLCGCTSGFSISGFSNWFGLSESDGQARRVTEPIQHFMDYNVSSPRARLSYPRRQGLPEPALPITPEVKKQIVYFSGVNRKFIVDSAKRYRRYSKEIESAFLLEGVPLTLINVGLIESGFEPSAKSYSGATGIWQFMKGTARVYDLKINILRDQRKDPKLSSRAAAKHLKDLYFSYRDWHLALAAYNGGSTRLDRAMNKSNLSDFWALSRAKILRKQTAEYVPKFIAVSLIMQNPQKYGFNEIEVPTYF